MLAPVQDALPAREPEAAARPSVRAEPRLSFNGWVALTVVVLHIAVFALFLLQRHVFNKPQPPVAMELLSIPPAPPPPADMPEVVVETPPVVIPPPLIQIENRPPTITAVVMENPPPPPPVQTPTVVAEGPPAPAPARAPAAISGGDLSASMIEAIPPRYPYESRRLKEQGTVVLDVLLGTDGRVSSIGIRTSSGHHRLDKAALEAVRRWRWSPTIREGQPVPVRGLVEIPFTLTH